MGDLDRQALVPLLSLLPGTRGGEKLEVARTWMVIDWHCRAWPSAWLRAAGCVEEAAALDAATAIVDAGTLRDSLEPLRKARAGATARRVAAMDSFIEDGLATALAAADAGEMEPAIAAARGAFRAGAGWPAIRRAQKSVPAAAGWDAARGARWGNAWDVAGYRLSIASETAQIAAARALAASSAWDAAWDIRGTRAGETWVLARDDARSAGREAALAVALLAAWTATAEAEQLAGWPAASDAADASVRAPATALQRAAIGLIAGLVALDLESLDTVEPHVRR
jgi:hypothetical protein